MILITNQIDAQFFMYVYFCSLHVSGSHVPIIRRIIASMRHLVFVTNLDCRVVVCVRLRVIGARDCRSLAPITRRRTQTTTLQSKLVTKTRCRIDAIILLMMGTWLPETFKK